MILHDILDKKVILFGAVENGITEFLLKNKLNVIAFVDNDITKHGGEIFGIPVQPVMSLNEYSDEDMIVLISTKNHWDEMEKQLYDMAIKDFIVAYRDIEDFRQTHFQAFIQNIEIDNPIIDTLHIELSSYCNCKCIYCPFHGIPNIKKQKNFMTWETLKKIVGQMKKLNTVTTLNVVGNGEIFLNKYWYEMLSYAVKELNIKKLIMYSNGMLFNEDVIRKIHSIDALEIHIEISIDGSTPEENDYYRKGSVYSVVKSNLLKACEIINEYKDGKIQLIITNCRPYDFNKVVENRALSNKMNTPEFLIKDFPDIISVSKKSLGMPDCNIPGLFPVKVKFPEDDLVCLDIFHQIAVDSSGKMNRCSCWNAGVVQIADVYKDDLIDIWYNDAQMKLAREHFIMKNQEPDFCYECPRRGMGSYYILTTK